MTDLEAELLATAFVLACSLYAGFRVLDNSARTVPRCDECSYDLTGLSEDARCPECDGTRRQVRLYFSFRMDWRCVRLFICFMLPIVLLRWAIAAAWYVGLRLEQRTHDASFSRSFGSRGIVSLDADVGSFWPIVLAIIVGVGYLVRNSMPTRRRKLLVVALFSTLAGNALWIGLDWLYGGSTWDTQSRMFGHLVTIPAALYVYADGRVR